MTFSASRLRAVLLLAGTSLVVAGVAALLVGAGALRTALAGPELTPVDGPAVTIPEGNGRTTVYTAQPPGDDPLGLGCELVGADGEPESGTRMDFLTVVLGDPATVDGTTWHPFTEIELAPSEATLTCPGDTLASAALSRPTLLGSLSGAIGAFALGGGVLFLVLGTLALVCLRWVPQAATGRRHARSGG